METEHKEIVKEYIHDDWNRKGVDNTARTLGVIGTVGAGITLLNGIGGGLFGRNYSGPENVNINTTGGGNTAPSTFDVYSHECSDILNLTNEIWGLKANTQNQMYAHRDTDINEKFQIWKSQVDADFGLYKSTRDSFDALTEKHNADVFALYKGNRDSYDALAEKIAKVERQVAINEAVRPYQDKLLQCQINEAFTSSVNYTDKKTCRAIYGELVLPSTPTVTGYASYNPCAPAASSSSAAA